MKGFIIAGTGSGCGKTTLSLAIMACLAKKGYKVAPFKVGPDFIDPGHHTRITGTVSRNLDGWMLEKSYNEKCFNTHSKGSNIAVVEGVMGLFDGYDGKSEAGSTAQMAKWTGLPVILVVNAKSMARSAAALVQGFENFDRELKFAGVIFNNIGSKRHLDFLREAIEDTVRMPCLGGILRNGDLAIPERHLGLVTDDEHLLSGDMIEKLASIAEDNLDMKKLVKACERHGSVPAEDSIKSKSSVRIAVARDKAFCFYYRDNLDMLEDAGAELVFFSPMDDHKLPENIGGIYLGGGYPELFGEQLSSNKEMLAEIKKRSELGMPIYGECGGFMYLCNSIKNIEGDVFTMAGCFSFRVSMMNRLKALGYREISLETDTILGMAGDVIRGHEFHYSTNASDSDTIKKVYKVSPRKGVSETPEGYMVENTLGSYVHIHMGSNQNVPRHFVNTCQNYSQKSAQR